MSATPAAVKLESLLSPSPNGSAASSTSSSQDHGSNRSSTLRVTSTSPSSVWKYWGSTWTSVLKYGSQGVEGEEAREEKACGEAKRKGKARGAIPSWPQGDTKRTDVRTDQERELEAPQVTPELLEDEDAELEQLLDSILWQVGPDVPCAQNDNPSGGSLLVLACSRLPGSTALMPHVRILDKLRSRLEKFGAKGSYSIVLLANPTPHPPSTPQLVSSYLALSRTTRKNLRKLWVVGGGWWTTVILTLFSTTFLSLKVSKKRKVVQCAHLSALAAELRTSAFTKIEFPLAVYIEDMKAEREIRLPESGEKPRPVFGTSLRQLCGSIESPLPRILEDCLQVLASQGPDSLGIFRRSPSASTVKILEQAYSRQHPVSLGTYPDAPYLAASLLKLFLRTLPEPILPAGIAEMCENCPLPPTSPRESINFIRKHVLPIFDTRTIELNVLKRVTRVLHEIASKSADNLMTSSNLVICLAPALMGGLTGASPQDFETIRIPGMLGMNGLVGGMSSDQEVVTSKGRNTVGGVLKIMIENYKEVFVPIETNESNSSSQSHS